MPNQLKPPSRSAVSRITAILSTFLTGGNHSVTEMARLTGLPVSTTHRIAVDLASWQLLHRSADGQYKVGIILRRWSQPMAGPGPLAGRRPTSIIDVADPRRSAEAGTVGLTAAHALVRFLAD